ncbi:hypothetical protein [Catenibacterium sp.]|uniref:hypothetical protein n=1 Tax=Catenibacterium sp. TaxID=2049022 RepID=UPI003995C949
MIYIIEQVYQYSYLENGIGWREDMTQEEVDKMLAEGRKQSKMIIVLIIIGTIFVKWKTQCLKMV